MQLNTKSIVSYVAGRRARENRNSHDPNATLRRFEKLCNKIAPLRDALLNHPIYAEVGSLSQTSRVHANPRVCGLGFHVIGETTSE
jgi:hypothetical protein